MCVCLYRQVRGLPPWRLTTRTFRGRSQTDSMKLKVTWKLPYWRSISSVSMHKTPIYHIPIILIIVFSSVISQEGIFQLCYCDVIAAVLKDTHESGTSPSLFTLSISFFPKKGEAPFTSGSTCGQTQTPPTRCSHTCQNSVSCWGMLDVLYCAGLLIVCNRLWSLPLCPTVSKRVGACEWGKKNTSGCFLSRCLCRSCRDGTHCHMVAVRCRCRLAVLGAVFHSPASFTSFFLPLFIGHHHSYLTVCLSVPALLFWDTQSCLFSPFCSFSTWFIPSFR